MQDGIRRCTVAANNHRRRRRRRSKTDDSETPLRFRPGSRRYVGSTDDTSWVHWVAVSSMDRTTATDSQRAQFLDAFDPDVIDWDSGLVFNRGQFARARGVACSSPKEYEYEESLQFGPSVACLPSRLSDANYTVDTWGNNGVSRDEHNRAVHYRRGPHLYMELNAPRWKSAVKQGNLRPAAFGDAVIQDNIGSGINKAGANYDDHSNARFLRWLTWRCAAGLPGCSSKVRAILQQRPAFNIRDHIRLLRAAHQPPRPPARVAMEPCGSTQFGTQGLTLGTDPSFVKFHDLRCLTTVNSNSTSSGTCEAAACVLGNVNQQWKFDSKSGHLISSRTNCAGNPHGGCCLSISSGHRSAGTIVQLFGCEGCPKAACAFQAQPSNSSNETLLTASRLCVTPGVQPPVPSVIGNAVMIQDPVLHEFIRHAYIS
eukprot:SAG31_NODE_7057_length_1801_cov_1.783784_2_plen_427_part_01